jgi:hypothetical protein
MKLDILREKIENLFFQYWSEMPKEKPTYTQRFYSTGGFQEKMPNLLLAASIPGP